MPVAEPKSKLVPKEFARLEHSGHEVIGHPSSECEEQFACPLHNRSVHTMRAMSQRWWPDRGIVERLCEHGVGHYDWDQYPYHYEALGKDDADAEVVHGCCSERCCQPPPPWLTQLYGSD